MSQCVTEPTATLYGETIYTPTAQLSTSLREETETVVEPSSFVLTSSCQGGGEPEFSATTEDSSCSTWSFPVVTTRTVVSTFTDIATLDGPAAPVNSSFPTETQYKTNCENEQGDQPTTTITPILVTTPTTIVSLSVSTETLPITINGEVSVTLLLHTISLLLTATATVTQNVTTGADSSSSPPIGVIAGAAAGGAIALTALAVGLLVFLRRKKKKRRAAESLNEDGAYGAIGAGAGVGKSER
ncbi:hypothetical protein BDY24DRAFT_380171 [Mrakia frigida]|uniref:uncharacterized protein n=1 Tax=Mrakia frigida TaxID=29902 RepID=UPI003FCC0FE5